MQRGNLCCYGPEWEIESKLLMEKNMNIKGIHHYSVIVSDLERSATFYRDVLGLEEIPIPETFSPAGISARWFALGSAQLHLILGDEPAMLSRRHAALLIGDAARARAMLADKGVEMKETTPIPGTDRFFVTDPDGNRIELIEVKTR
jgi:glyoxylase I family protein